MRCAILNWRVGETIQIRRDGRLRVIGIVAGTDDDDEPTLIVEDAARPDAP